MIAIFPEMNRILPIPSQCDDDNSSNSNQFDSSNKNIQSAHPSRIPCNPKLMKITEYNKISERLHQYCDLSTSNTSNDTYQPQNCTRVTESCNQKYQNHEQEDCFCDSNKCNNATLLAMFSEHKIKENVSDDCNELDNNHDTISRTLSTWTRHEGPVPHSLGSNSTTTKLKQNRGNLPIFRMFITLFIVVQSILLVYELFDPIRRTYSINESIRTYMKASNRYRSKYITYASAFDELERIELRDEAKKMFYHAYYSYINTYPADEILPISCQGRFRQSQDLSEIDDSIGNFSLTLVDSLDTLVMMGDLTEFDSGIKRIIKDINFDMDVVVSVFETNIRMLGGLLSAHVLAKSIQDQSNKGIRHFNQTERSQLDWYKSELLDLAEDLGRRLLPAFDTKTGIPHPRVNLRFGLETNGLRSVRETCTACAGSLILEFATLSRLTGSSIYEEKARAALDAIWDHRHRSTNLVGTVLHIDSGEWVRRESGVGAGSDSYYEYLMKAYILLGDPTYLYRFNRHYSSVMRYISRGPFLIDVHMHRPNRVAKGFMDALSAFWPGLQVLKGDLRSAISTHAMFNEVIRRHSYLPEAFTTDLQVYWANHQMRPEFLESTFFLHRATQEDYYLEIGKDILKKLQDLRVDCGFAGLKDVRTGVHDDRMSSFVLAETLKYLYLLFSTDNETYIDLERFIFSTEGHLLPMNLASTAANLTRAKLAQVNAIKINNYDDVGVDEVRVKLISESELLRAAKDGSDASTSTNVEEAIGMKDGKASGHLSETSINGAILEKSAKRTKSEQANSAAIARLLMKMSDKFNQDKSAINFADYEDSCPSLEAQEMRFDSRYHPFLNKWISGAASATDAANALFKTQLSHMQLLERVKEFTTTDPDYLRLSTAWGLAVTVQSNGLVKLLLNPELAGSVAEEQTERASVSTRLIQETEGVGSTQCMM